MIRRHVRASRNSDDELDEALAALIAGTRSKKRALSLTRIANLLKVAVSELGTYLAVAERVGISAKMLRQFSNVERLSKPVKDLFEERTLDSVDAATHLAMLSDGDQLPVARALADGLIDTGDVRAVVQSRATRPTEPIQNLVDRVRDSKTKQHYVAEFIIRGLPGQRELLTEFSRYIHPADIIKIETDGALGRLVLTRSGKDQLSRAAKNLGVSTKHVIAEILSGSSAE